MSTDDRLDQLDYYTLLGVARDASAEDVKRAFRAFARRYHPDRFAGQDGEKVARATRIYRRGSEAVQTLSDPTARRAYDAVLAKGELRLKSDARAPVEPAPKATRREPEPAKPTLQSPTARAFFTKAQDAARAGDLQTAWRQIKAAMQHEPGSPILEQALLKIERAMRGW
ncbi:J domain-containing protein [Sandaracinus amylolyticus]|uniref:Chaperone protein DnaJ n=1 Tax=Sandaracinus amylolyticus TaxID=927083 RepID=A0A0F6YIY0_9BACT|nr:DnaJ domain-containing protein [Sandaracinus amylolyticus]AKF06276.1 Chaperone protein DnaJ [Sandaracinus amylolyticus]